jgi:hypothetical protein
MREYYAYVLSPKQGYSLILLTPPLRSSPYLTPPPVGVLPFKKGENYAQTFFIAQTRSLSNSSPLILRGVPEGRGVNICVLLEQLLFYSPKI